MRCLVTGASGFVGGHLTRRLRELGHDVWTLVHDEEPFIALVRTHRIRGSLTEVSTCERAVVESRADVVFHLGAQAIVPIARRDPLNTLEANVRGTYNLLEAFRRYRVPGSVIVVASSDKAYGEVPRVPIVSGALGREHETLVPRPYSETDPLEGRGPYDVSKSCADLIAQSYAHEFHLPVGIVRAGNIYGPGDRDMTRIVPCVASALAQGEAPVLTSDGTPVRDYLYVDDAVAAYQDVWGFVSGLPDCVGSAFNFSGGEPISAEGLARLAIDVVGKTGALEPMITGTRTGEIQDQVLDSRKARMALGWRPRTGLREGLRRTIEWWRERLP